MAPALTTDGDFETRLRDSFARQQVMTTLRAKLSLVAPGRVEIEMPFSPAHTQQHGFLHAGIISTVLDSACGYAAYTVMPADAAVLTIEFKVNLLSPGKGERFLFRGSVTKPGRTIIVADGEAYGYDSEGNSRHVATMTGTMMTVSGRNELKG